MSDAFELIVTQDGQVSRYHGHAYIDSDSRKSLPFRLRTRQIWPAKLMRMSRRRRKICLKKRIERLLSAYLQRLHDAEGGVINSPELRASLAELVCDKMPKIEVYVDTKWDAT